MQSYICPRCSPGPGCSKLILGFRKASIQSSQQSVHKLHLFFPEICPDQGRTEIRKLKKRVKFNRQG
jgi:hypothetical protein